MLFRRLFHNAALSVCLSALILAGAGCAQEEFAGARAKGKILFNGAPLKEGTVMFNPVGVGSLGVGLLDENGEFTVSTGASMQGVYPGDYKVTVESWLVPPETLLPDGSYDMKGKSRIPRSYGSIEKSGLTATIIEAGPNEFVFELQGQSEASAAKVGG